MIASFACALIVLSLVAWATGPRPIARRDLAWFFLGGGALVALHGLVARHAAGVAGDPGAVRPARRHRLRGRPHLRPLSRSAARPAGPRPPPDRGVPRHGGSTVAPGARPGRNLQDLLDHVRRRADRRDLPRPAVACRAPHLEARGQARPPAGRPQALSRPGGLCPDHGDRRAPCRRADRDAAPPADPRLGEGRQADHRRRPQRHRTGAVRAPDGPDRARDQAGFAGPGPVPPAASGLRSRRVRAPQVSHHAPRPGRAIHPGARRR